MSADPRTTLFVSVCSGSSQPGCGEVYRTRVEKWSGAAQLVTHGVCPECYEREADLYYQDAAIDEVLEIEGDTSPPWDREPRKFGNGPGEMPGSAVVSTLAAAEARRARIGRRIIALQFGCLFVALGLLLLAVAAIPTGTS